MTESKHDAACLERRQWGDHMRFVCTCGLSDREVHAAWPAFRARVNSESAPPPRDGWRLTTWRDPDEILSEIQHAVGALSCDYYHHGGTCSGGCVDEPLCHTGAPSEGWETRLLFLAGELVQSSELTKGEESLVRSSWLNDQENQG